MKTFVLNELFFQANLFLFVCFYSFRGYGFKLFLYFIINQKNFVSNPFFIFQVFFFCFSLLTLILCCGHVSKGGA